MLPRFHLHRHISGFYQDVQPLFDCLTGGSGFTNFGYAEGPEVPDSTIAQKALVRRVAQTLPRPGTWLDVGCGTGGPSCLLAQDDPSIRIIGVDIVGAQLALAWQRAFERSLFPRVVFRNGSASALPAADGVAEGLYSIEAAFHFPDKVAFLGEARRVLRSGGRIAVADIVRKSECGFLERAVVQIGQHTIAVSELFTADDWRGALRMKGFVDIEIEDITRQTFAMLPFWVRRLDHAWHELRGRYPWSLLMFYRASLGFFIHCAERPPLAYIQVTATAP